MNDSATRLGRRGLLRAGVGVGAAATLTQSATAQEESNTSTDNETAGTENGTTENGTAGGETGGDMETENSTADTESETGGGSGLLGSGELSSQGRLTAVLGVLGLGLLSPLVFALVLKLVYEDDSPSEDTRPPGQ